MTDDDESDENDGVAYLEDECGNRRYFAYPDPDGDVLVTENGEEIDPFRDSPTSEDEVDLEQYRDVARSSDRNVDYLVDIDNPDANDEPSSSNDD